MSGWAWAWIAWALWFAAMEATALVAAARARRRGGRDRHTLSAQLWWLAGTAPGTRPTAGAWVRRGVLVLALVWLAVHLLSGGQLA